MGWLAPADGRLAVGWLAVQMGEDTSIGGLASTGRGVTADGRLVEDWLAVQMGEDNLKKAEDRQFEEDNLKKNMGEERQKTILDRLFFVFTPQNNL